MKNCLFCNKELSGKQVKYCSNSCQMAYNREQYIARWKNDEETGCTSSGGLSEHVRNYLLHKTNSQCELCGWGKIHPITLRVPLEIHHIDGNSRNCMEDNLQVLCPNCHSLTANFGSLNTEGRGELNTRKKYCQDCGQPIDSMSIRCRQCEAKTRITTKPATRDELKMLIRSQSFVDIGKQFNVSDTAIRKWCAGYGLPTKKKDIKTYSDEEWSEL